MVTHIGPNGPGECGALQGKCPFGPENHFPTAAEAIAVWEAKLAEEHPPFKTKLRQPEGFAAVEAKRMESYRILNERMTQEFGQDWPARIALSDPGAQQAYNSYSMTTEGFERQLKGMRFAVKDKAPELADLKKERSMIESWLSRRFEGRWNDWKELRDTPEFDDYRELLDRGEDIGVFLKSIKS